MPRVQPAKPTQGGATVGAAGGAAGGEAGADAGGYAGTERVMWPGGQRGPRQGNKGGAER